MARKRFAAEKIVLMLREAEVQLANGMDLAQVCWPAPISCTIS